MQAQNEKLKRTGRNLKRIQDSAIPGLDKIMGLIKKAELKNTVIIAMVIAFCIVVIIYLEGFSNISAMNNNDE